MRDRAANHHSMNYRSAVVHGAARPVEDPGVNAREFAAVSVLALDLAEASVKMRAGAPSDDPSDVETGLAWAGVLPVRTTFGDPVPAGNLPPGMEIPAHVSARRTPRNS